MPEPSLFAQIFAVEPRKLVRYPDAPLDEALGELTRIQKDLDAIVAASESAKAEAVASANANEVTDGLLHSLASIVTNVWRTRAKMVDATGAPREEMKRAYRHVESAFENFNQAGLMINDLADQPYDAGLPVKVLAFQPTPEVTRDTIIEVVRPTIIWRDKLIQMGEVIVGIPENSPSRAP